MINSCILPDLLIQLEATENSLMVADETPPDQTDWTARFKRRISAEQGASFGTTDFRLGCKAAADTGKRVSRELVQSAFRSAGFGPLAAASSGVTLSYESSCRRRCFLR